MIECGLQSGHALVSPVSPRLVAYDFSSTDTRFIICATRAVLSTDVVHRTNGKKYRKINAKLGSVFN